MDTLLIVGLGILAAGYLWYMTLVGRRNKVLESLSGIEVQLTKRHDLVPNVLKVARAFMEHERDLLEEITRLRTEAQAGLGARSGEAVAAHLKVESALQASLSRLFALAENYPQLKSDATMLQAQATYNEVEEHIAASRRFYNAAVTALNNAAQIFPGSLIAAMASITPYPFYDAPDAVHAPVDADAFLKRNA